MDSFIQEFQDRIKEHKRVAKERNKRIAYLESLVVSQWTPEQLEEAKERYELGTPFQSYHSDDSYSQWYEDIPWHKLSNAQKIEVMYRDRE